MSTLPAGSAAPASQPAAAAAARRVVWTLPRSGSGLGHRYRGKDRSRVPAGLVARFKAATGQQGRDVHLREGCGVRATSRLTGVSRDTISRYLARAGEQAKSLHDELVAFSPSDP